MRRQIPTQTNPEGICTQILKKILKEIECVGRYLTQRNPEGICKEIVKEILKEILD